MYILLFNSCTEILCNSLNILLKYQSQGVTFYNHPIKKYKYGGFLSYW